MRFRTILAGLGIASLGIIGIAYAQGIQILTTVTGTEQIPFNYPCTVSCGATVNTVSSYTRGQPGLVNYTNALIGGDFSTNPYQRGTSQAANISNSLTYGPDQWWFLGGASSAIQWSQATAPTALNGFLNYNKFQRASANADTAAICMGQVLETKNAVRFQNHTAMLEFWIDAGANYSGGAVTVTVAYGTDTDGTAANFASGSWTNYTAATNATNAAGTTMVNTVTPTATWTKVIMGFTIPQTVAATQVTDLGIKFCWTPAGTAGANDFIGLAGIQLEVNDTKTASSFNHLPVQTVLYLSQRYFQAIAEPAAGVVLASGLSDSTTTCIFPLALADTMRIAPTVSFAGTALAGTTFKVRKGGADIVLSTPFLAASVANTPTSLSLVATTGATQVQATPCLFEGAAGGAKIWASAEL